MLPKGPEESRARADGALGPNASAMARNSALDGGQTDSGAGNSSPQWSRSNGMNNL